MYMYNIDKGSAVRVSTALSGSNRVTSIDVDVDIAE